MNILLVEDDLLLAKGTAKLIERLGGHRVYTTAEPEEIFQQCRVGEIDLVLMDVNLPGAKWEGEYVGGAEVSRLLKTQEETAHIPIIILTAYAMAREGQTLLSASGADELCIKPIKYEPLLELIERWGSK